MKNANSLSKNILLNFITKCRIFLKFSSVQLHFRQSFVDTIRSLHEIYTAQKMTNEIKRNRQTDRQQPQKKKPKKTNFMYYNNFLEVCSENDDDR